MSEYTSLWKVAQRTYKEVGGRGDTGIEELYMRRMRRRDHWMFMQLTTPQYGAVNISWALCNLSKQEYIRADAVAKLTKAPLNGPLIKGSIGLGEVLLSQICWSSYASTFFRMTATFIAEIGLVIAWRISTMNRLEGMKTQVTGV
ncbi:hypothetical protein AcW1_007079 [Taiwanofungus camphoratus]|nr:hypothetical protein AcW2_005890 [Antrodia cinnamomea]KAI0955520.1 hypothetical protein AcW1_007079 [Antrodia cinnamomea]